VPGYSQELEPASPVCEPQLSQLLRRFRNVREVNPDENVRMPLRVTDDTLPALLVGRLTSCENAACEHSDGNCMPRGDY